jgi:glycerol-3-phosphate dehydrogenase subunit B
MSDDVLVVGGGIEGYSAALSALTADPSASVRILEQADRFALETGVVDLLGYEPDGTGPVENPLSAVDRLPDSHPYAQLGLEPIRAALELFDNVTGERYAGAKTETNALLPTAVGHLAPATRYPRSVANGVVSGPAMRLVGFERLPDFDAELAAARLSGKTPLDTTGRTIQSPLSGPPTEMAAALDADVTGDQQTVAALARALEPRLDVEPRIGLAAVLGESETPTILDELATRLHVSVFEVPLGPPSLPGRRLKSLLAAGVESRGGTIERAGVTDVNGRQEAIAGVVADGTEYEADAYVLATGGVEAGGIVGPELRESVFDCPVAVSDDQLVAEQFLGDHPAVGVGVETDADLRPVDGHSAVAENLYAAGRVLDSPNVVADHAAGGFALVTGYEAGRRACEQY